MCGRSLSIELPSGKGDGETRVGLGLHDPGGDKACKNAVDDSEARFRGGEVISDDDRVVGRCIILGRSSTRLVLLNRGVPVCHPQEH